MMNDFIADKDDICLKQPFKYDTSTIYVVSYNIMANTVSPVCTAPTAQQQVKFPLSEDVAIQHGTGMYLIKYKLSEITKIEKKMQVKVTPNQEKFTISGPMQGIDKAKQKLEQLQQEVMLYSYPVDKPGMERYLNAHSGTMSDIENIGSQYQAVILSRHVDVHSRSPCNATVVYRQKGAAGPTVHSVHEQLLDEVKTASGVHIKVYQGDLTEHKVDALVNAANGNLKHIEGLAYAIVSKGRTLAFIQGYKV